MNVLYSTLNAKMLGFEHVKELCGNDNDFDNVYHASENSIFGQIYRLNGYLFKKNRLCVLVSSICELLICKAHEDGLMRYFGVAKTLDVLRRIFIGLRWKRIYNAYVINALHVEKLSLRSNYMVYILFCLNALGRYFNGLCFRFTWVKKW